MTLAMALPVSAFQSRARPRPLTPPFSRLAGGDPFAVGAEGDGLGRVRVPGPGRDLLTKLADGDVTFRYQDYADSRKEKLLTLSAEEFLRRFVQHVLPKGFMKIRHYGLLE